MNKSVLISIKPYYVFLILAHKMGWNITQEKTIEVRKDFPKDKAWNKVVHIYCSKDKKSFNRIPKEYQPLIGKFIGKVIGEFVCNRIEKFVVGSLACDDVEQKACISYREICDYFYGKNYDNTVRIGYAWHISDLKIYDKPKELGEFKKLCHYKDLGSYCIMDKCEYYSDWTGICCNWVEIPPQNWGYVESLGE